MAESVVEESIIPKIFGPVETVLGFTGLSTPFRRFAVFTAIGTGIEYWLRPSYAYNDQGGMKRIAYLTDAAGATYTPPGFFPAILGLVSALYF